MTAVADITVDGRFLVSLYDVAVVAMYIESNMLVMGKRSPFIQGILFIGMTLETGQTGILEGRNDWRCWYADHWSSRLRSKIAGKEQQKER
jgi:hypothetical protein